MSERMAVSRPRWTKPAIFLLLSLCAVNASVSQGREAGLWERYKKTFISADGRVIDFLQGEVSHSEGQGYSMLLAIEYNDRETFGRVWSWTASNLAVRSDGLLAWLWGKRANGAWGVIDYNNATDGDLLVAMALVKAGEKWKDRALTESGLALARAIKSALVVSVKGHDYLLPGYYGFTFNGGFSLNPSYMIFPAFRLFARADQEGRRAWEKIYEDSRSLIRKSSFGHMGLPGDWVVLDLDGSIRLHHEKSPYSGKESVRVFLYAAFDNQAKSLTGLEQTLDFYGKYGLIPLQVNLLTGELAMEPAPGGFYAVFAKAAAAAGRGSEATKLFKAAREALDREVNDYYSMVLYLLATSEEVL